MSPLPSRVLLLVVGALIVAACSSTTGPATTDSAPAPTSTIPAETEPTPTSTLPLTTTTTTAPAVSAREVFAGVRDGHGGASMGDSYYPRLGNGGYDVTHVDLAIDFRDLDRGGFAGVAALQVQPVEELASFVIDTGTLSIEEVRVNGSAATFTTESNGEIRIALLTPSASPFELVIEYSGRPEPMFEPAISFEVGIRPGPDAWFAVSEPSGATTWFPANDHPLDKATYTISLTVDDGLTGIAGGILTGSDAAIGGGTTFTWDHRHPVASYLVPLAVGRFEMVERESVEGVAIRDFIDPDIERGLLGNLDNTGEFLAWMIGVFGDYPFDAYGTLALDVTFGGALETQTLATHGADALGSTVIIHEMAHMWFGDSVSVADWSHIWLNEGFATYSQWLWVEHDRGVDLYNKVARSGFDGYRGLRAPGTPAPNDLFNGGVYVGGASVLHALRIEIGDGAFFALLKAWAQDNAYGNVTTGDFVDMAERFGARQLDDFFEIWLAGDGPEYVPLG